MAPRLLVLALLLTASARAQMPAPVALDQTETEAFFKTAKLGLLSKKVISDGKPYFVRCAMLEFLKDGYSKKVDDAAYEKLVDDAIANTELFYADPSCREKLDQKEHNVVAIAVPAKSHKAAEKVCGGKFGDPKKDAIFIFSKQAAKGVPMTAHEVAHIMLAGLDGAKFQWDVHHGLTNFMLWNKGTPSKSWSASEQCRRKEGSQSTGLLSFSGGHDDKPEYEGDALEQGDGPPPADE